MSAPTPRASEATPRLAYQPALDGLRAVAVFGVLLYHGEVAWARGGFLGVDAFFVLSGYLITTLLLHEWRGTGGVDVRAFWIRRARRLLPALLLVVAAVAAWVAWADEPFVPARLRGDALGTLFYVANWQQIFTGASYFETFALPSPFRHTWSLAIEEQWYLIWPFALVGLLRISGGIGRRLLAAIGALAVASAALMAVLHTPGGEPSRVYYGTDTRAQSLLIGAGLAVLLLMRSGPRCRWGRTALQSTGVVAGGLTLWMWWSLDDASNGLYEGGLTAGAIAVAVVIAAAVQPGPCAVGRVLALRPLRAIGRISYGLYLWHWPVYVALRPSRVDLDSTQLLLARLAVTFALATVSYVWVERPIRDGVLRRRGRGWVLAPVSAFAVVVTLVLATSSLFVPQGRVAAAPDTSSLPSRPAGTAAPAGADTVDVLLAGDSVAFSLGYQADAPGSLPPGVVLSTEAALGCGIARGVLYSDGADRPTTEVCESWPERWRRRAEQVQPDVAIVMLGAWEVFDRRLNGELVRFGSRAYEQYLRRELDEAYRILAAHADHVVLLTTPCFAPPDEDLGEWGSERGDASRVAWLNAQWRSFVAETQGRVSMVDLGGFLCPDGEAVTERDGAVVRYDGIHLSREGAVQVWRWLWPRVAAQLAN